MAVSSTFSGWHKDAANDRLDLYYKGTRIGHLNSSRFTLAGSQITNSIVQNAGLTSALKTQVARLGTVGAVASNGAGAIVADMAFVAPADIKIVAAWRTNISASDVTKGTATTSASFRRLNLITNTAGTGSGTNIVASLNATASAASNATRSFTTVASTVPSGAIILASHLTVGAETADGTDMAASIVHFAYELV